MIVSTDLVKYEYGRIRPQLYVQISDSSRPIPGNVSLCKTWSYDGKSRGTDETGLVWTVVKASGERGQICPLGCNCVLRVTFGNALPCLLVSRSRGTKGN